MREILFRGEYVETGDWVKGFYVKLHDDHGRETHRIYPGYAETDCGNYYPDFYEVAPETVGQFTGLTDKNGKKIFEGDIVKTNKFNTPNKLYVIKFDLLLGAFIGEAAGTMYFTTFDGDSDDFEIIGNIHDNPELLGGVGGG